jgi:hypothetical protein
MAAKTLIGFQNSSDNKITVLEYCDDPGQLSTTGKILNNLYNSTTLAKKLIKEGTLEQRIDVSSIVNIDNYTWCVLGTDFNDKGVKIYNSSSEFLERFSNSWYQYLYMFSESDNEWQVASNDNQTFRSLASEL